MTTNAPDKVSLYKSAVEHCLQSFQARMKIPGRGVAFVQQLDAVHEAISNQLKDELIRIEKIYSDSMEQLMCNIGKGLGGGAGLGSIFFGAVLASLGPGVWLIGALFGAIFGGAAGAISYGIMTKADADNQHLRSLQDSFQKEVDFVTGQQNALGGRIRQVRVGSGEYQQLKALETHFQWVIDQERSIDFEAHQIKQN